MRPKISIIIATYNSEATLERALKSVVSQEFDAKELLVVDGASTDGTLDIIGQYQKNMHWWITEKDTGVYDAWNKALQHANGEWVYFLGSDDYLWDSQVLTQAAWALDASGARTRIAYGQVAFTTKKSAVIGMAGEPWCASTALLIKW
ncbi:MAG: glycosyltransferase [Halioglobus sp.]